MKNCLFAFCAALLFTSCAGVKVSHTEIATGATNPRAIYIRPFDVSSTVFKGRHGGSEGERVIRHSLAPRQFAENLKEELEKIAPATILEPNETAPLGWLVEGQFDVIDAGSPTSRALVGLTGLGRSTVVLHVRIVDVERRGHVSSGKNEASAFSTEATSSEGRVIYEFDLTGGSGASGRRGSIVASGIGYSVPFDFRNAAERIRMALSTDPHRYGIRTSPTIP